MDGLHSLAYAALHSPSMDREKMRRCCVVVMDRLHALGHDAPHSLTLSGHEQASILGDDTLHSASTGPPKHVS